MEPTEESCRAKMPAFTVKNIPADLMERLKASAADNGRSVNKEIIVCLERSLKPLRKSVSEEIDAARYIRKRVGPMRVTQKELQEAKNKGRP